MNKDMRVFVLLAAAAVNNTKADSDIKKILDLDTIYKAAAQHQMTALIAFALDQIGVTDSRFQKACVQTMWHTLVLDKERKAVLQALENAHVWYMPMKGVILREYYPEIIMRQMSDNDILFDASKAEDVKTIMEQLGFTTIHFGDGFQDDYQKPRSIHFEMHRELVPALPERLYKYYRDFEDKLLIKNGYERHFTNEDFYIYMVAHEYKHFYWNGTGLRSLLDVYVFLQKNQNDLDWIYIKSEIDKIGISDFEEKNRKLALRVFDKDTDVDQLNKEEEEMLENFYTAGIYGFKERGIQNKVKALGKAKYLIQRFALPMSMVEIYYPFFYKHKVLLPILLIYRLYRNWKKAIMEVKTIRRFD